MTGAVHGFEGELLLVNIEHKHVVFVVLPVLGSFPELFVVHVGADDFREAALAVLFLDEVDEGVVNAGAVRQPEGRTRGKFTEEEELLILYRVKCA